MAVDTIGFVDKAWARERFCAAKTSVTTAELFRRPVELNLREKLGSHVSTEGKNGWSQTTLENFLPTKQSIYGIV